MTRKRSLTCTCCGSDAGVWQQHWNLDAGFGLCAACASWIRSRWPEPSESFDRTYGAAGVNREAPTHDG